VSNERLAQLRAEGGCYPVEAVTRFAVTGADRLRYLNGQVSNDLRKLTPGTAMQACILSAKGKLDAVVWIWNEDQQLVVECDSSLAEALGMRLERYVVADDVQIAPMEVVGVFHVFGAAAVGLSGLHVARLGVPGVDVPASSGIPVATVDEVEYLRIERCIPKWGAELGPDTLPAEAGLDATAVDFHKGCYIGQEVVSRIRSVGHANRSLRVFEVVKGEPPSPGTEFFTPAQTGRPAATVTSVHFGLFSAIGLCYIKRGTPEDAVLESSSCQIQIRQPACAQPS
jgi:folate-binding protein YgfZ